MPNCPACRRFRRRGCSGCGTQPSAVTNGSLPTSLDSTNGRCWRRALPDLGSDGGMLDLGELIPADSLLGDGSTGRESRNRYPLLYAESAWQAATAVRPDGDFALVLRTGAVGAQRFQSAQW